MLAAALTGPLAAQAPPVALDAGRVQVQVHDWASLREVLNDSLLYASLRGCARLFGYPAGLAESARAHAGSTAEAALAPALRDEIILVATPTRPRPLSCIADARDADRLLTRGLYMALDSTLSPAALPTTLRLWRDGVEVDATRAPARPLMIFTPRTAKEMPSGYLSHAFDGSTFAPTASGAPLLEVLVRTADGDSTRTRVNDATLQRLWAGMLGPLEPELRVKTSESRDELTRRSLQTFASGDTVSGRILALQARRHDACHFVEESSHPFAKDFNALHWRERHCRATPVRSVFVTSLLRPRLGHPARPHSRATGTTLVVTIGVIAAAAVFTAEQANDQYRDYLAYFPAGTDGSVESVALYNRANRTAQQSRTMLASAVGLWLGNAGWSLWQEYRGRRRATEARR